MEMPTSKRYKFTGDLDRNLAILGLIFSSILILSLVLTVGSYIEVGVLLFLACAAYLSMRRHLFTRDILSLRDLTAKRSTYLILNLIFYILFFYSVISVVLRPELYSRPLEYFVSTAIMTTILAIEILFLPKRKYYTASVLMKIMLIALSLRWIPQFIFPGLIGIDPWAHQMFATKILEAGTIPGGYPYSELPVMHLIIDATALVTGLNYKFATMLSISMLQVVGLIFVFLLGRFVFNSKIGLLAALLLGIAGLWIALGVGVHPTTIGLVLVALSIYMILKAREEKSFILSFLSLLVMGVLILTHTITALCLAVLLFSFWLGYEAYKRLYRQKFYSPVTLYLSILFTVGMFTWWTYASGQLSTIKEIIEWGFRIERWQVAESSTQYMQTVPYFEILLSKLGFFLFFTFSIIGSFYLLAKRFGNKHSFALALGGLVLVVIAFFSLALELSGFLPHRWWLNAYLIMAIPAAVGFFLVCTCFKSKLSMALVLGVLIFMISFFSITAPEANFDNRIYTQNTAARSAFTESELCAMNTISNLWDGRVGVASSSAYYYFDFNRDMVVEETASNLYSRDFTDCTNMIVIIRDEVVNNYFSFSGGGMKLDYDPREVLEEQGFDHLYDNGSVSAFLKP
ncbi:hypothetical protein ES703_50102 [subsurface metagenome]